MTHAIFHRVAWCTSGLLLALFFGCSGRVQGPPTGAGGGDGGDGGDASGNAVPPSPCGSYLNSGDCCNDPQKYNDGCIWLDPMPELSGGCVSNRDCTSGDWECPKGQACTVMNIYPTGKCSILTDVKGEKGVCIDE